MNVRRRNKMRLILPVFLFLFLAGCVPASHAVPTATAIPALSPTASASLTLTFLPPPTRVPPIPLRTPHFPPLPGKLQWPVKDARDLKQQLKDAQVIVVRMEGFRYCASSYDHDGQATIDQKACTDLEFELGEQQRQRLIEAIDESETQAGEIPEELQGGNGSPIFALPYPEFSVSLISPKFHFSLHWATERSFNVSQIYYPNLPKGIWDLPGELRKEDAHIGFVQEKPALYQAVKAILPTTTFPPEHPASLLAYERVVAAFDGKRCAYGDGNDSYLSVRNFIYGLLYTSIPVKEAHPTGEPRVVFTFWVRGQAYELDIWKNEKFFYQGKTYKYISQTSGPFPSLYVEPQPSSNLEDVLLGLTVNECTPPQ